jgi:RNA polymerase sigma-70 factor (ECF subfamily)
VWSFAVARNAAAQVLRKLHRERKRSQRLNTTLSGRLAEQVRTETNEYMKTDVKQRFAELRQQLTAEEQAVLVLRMTERLAWDDIARIQLGDAGATRIKKEAARLRKQYQLVREKLRRMARESGLLEG